MDERAWDPGLKRYIQILIDRAKGRAVLQFNRVDFRLAWLRQHFPAARLVHLFRNPRDQWCSTLMDPECFGPQGRIENFGPHDKFYLLNWCRDLKYVFPFLDQGLGNHPYELFYLLWKLSYLYGAAQADCSLAFEQLCAEPRVTLQHLLGQVQMPDSNLDAAWRFLIRHSPGNGPAMPMAAGSARSNCEQRKRSPAFCRASLCFANLCLKSRVLRKARPRIDFWRPSRIAESHLP